MSHPSLLPKIPTGTLAGTTTSTPNRATRRTQERSQRDHDRIVRQLALRTAAAIVEQDASVSGFTVIGPDGSVTYLDAEALRDEVLA